MPLKAGMLLNDRYKIIEVLGAGDFGTVYRASYQRPASDGTGRPVQGNEVAIKEMPMPMIVDCERQADLRGALDHPAIPRIYGYFAAGPYAYLVQELIPGCNLEAALARQDGFIPEKTVLGWAIQLCDTLHYLHNHPYHPIIFRDVKPNNIMVTPEERVYLVDFGLARAYPPRFFEEELPQFAHLWRGLDMGTAGYSPPEQYEGYVTPQSDLYALGATLHHLLTRRDPRTQPPFTFEAVSMRSLNPHISAALESIILKSLNRDLDKRFASARQMQVALEEVLASHLSAS
ncbi:MAG: serine/threonine protein kinase [Chloroflexota bacterium]